MSTAHTLHLSLIGSGGDGVMVTAAMLLRAAARIGLYGMMTQSYGPQIRGGESAAHVTLGAEPVGVVGHAKDLILAFRFADIARFAREIGVTPRTALVHGIDGGTPPDIPDLLRAAAGPKYAVNFPEILERHGLPEMTKNMLCFGILLRAFGWPTALGQAGIEEAFAHKGASVIATNRRAFEVGYREGERYMLPFSCPVPLRAIERLVVSGNGACAHAAVDAGCRFFAGYPITPSSEILEEMHELLPAVGGRLIQSEDEIAALGMVVGASYGGVPAMTATSGPGLSLMTEMLGLAGMAEIPLVIVDCQRAGPSTGIPSQTEQSDLWHCLYGGHGDFPRVVLAPIDVPSCYAAMFRAFYCAETFQLPAIVLSDAAIAQRSEIIERVDTTDMPRGRRLTAAPPPGAEYLRFDPRAMTDAAWMGVNAMALPGTPRGMHGIAGIEHTARGTPSSDGEQHQLMNAKRFRKLVAVAGETADWYRVVGEDAAPIALIAWGSSAGVAAHYVAGRRDAALFIPEILHPFPLAALRRFLAGRDRVIVLEMNYQGQLYHHLRAIGALGETAISCRRSGGMPYQLEEIHRAIAGGCHE